MSINFTDFFQESNLYLTHEQILCEGGRYFDPLDLCIVLDRENIIEIGSITEYPLNRLDVKDVTLPFYQFWQASFVIKNLPTPDFTKEGFKPLNVTFVNGQGKGNGKTMSNALFYPEITPGIIADMGTVFYEGDDTSTGFEMATYFVPEIEMKRGTFF